MSLTIYFENKPLYLIPVSERAKKSDLLSIELDQKKTNDPAGLFHFIHEADKSRFVIYSEDPESTLKEISESFKTIEAGGGFVYNEHHEVLMIFRRGKWDLPKGKLDEGETIEQCAEREIEEETGIDRLQLKKPLKITYHTYLHKGKVVLKKSHWFLFFSDTKKKPMAQVEEDIEKCLWVPVKNLSNYIEDAHASVGDVLRKGLEMLHESRNV